MEFSAQHISMDKHVDSQTERNTQTYPDTPTPTPTALPISPLAHVVRCLIKNERQHRPAQQNLRATPLLVNSPARKMPHDSTDQTGASLNSPPLRLSGMTGECRSRDLTVSETIN